MYHQNSYYFNYKYGRMDDNDAIVCINKIQMSVTHINTIQKRFEKFWDDETKNEFEDICNTLFETGSIIRKYVSRSR